MKAKLEEIHPGEILSEEFLRPLRIDDARFATELDVPLELVEEIINGKTSITAEIAMRLGLYFGTDPRFWLNLQTEYDIRRAEADLLPVMKQRIRPHADQPA